MQKHVICAVVLGCASAVGFAAMDAQTTGTTGTTQTTTAGTAVNSGSQTQSGAASGTQGGSDTDKQFLMNASQSDYTEITFSKLAIQKSTNPAVKKYAEKMIKDHNKLETEMKPFANKYGVSPVTSLDANHQQKYDQLSSMSGADFDKMYMSDMDTDHHKSLDMFKAEESATTDSSFKAVVMKGQKIVAEHTAMADKINAQLGGTSAGM